MNIRFEEKTNKKKFSDLKNGDVLKYADIIYMKISDIIVAETDRHVNVIDLQGKTDYITPEYTVEKVDAELVIKH